MKQLAIGSRVEEYVLEEVLGEGAFGRVYKASRIMPDGKETYAIKHISMPSHEQYNEMLVSMNGDVEATNAYFRNALKDIVTEFTNMRDLSRKDSRYFVTYYDYKIYGSPQEYDVFVRMELMTALNAYLKTNELKIKDVIKIGDNIGKALQVCHERHMVHRDVKEGNIFVDNDGDFKLGDFGVATTLEKTQQLVSRKGTPIYMAPEMLLGKEYSFDVDVYALCVVLYKMFNCNRPPFFPQYPNPYDASDVEVAQNKKLAGERPELPINARNALGEAIVKGILPAGQRYGSADEFLEAFTAAAKQLDQVTLNSVIISPGANAGANAASSIQAKGSESDELHNFNKASRVTAADLGYRQTTATTGTYMTTGTNYSLNDFGDGIPPRKPKKFLYIPPVIGSVLLILMLWIIIGDIHFSSNGKPLFFDNLAVKLILLIIAVIAILIPIIYIIVYPDRIKAHTIDSSKDWKKRCKRRLEEIKELIESKTKAELDKEDYKQVMNGIKIVERNIAESKAFSKSTQESLKHEKMAFYELSKLRDYLRDGTMSSDGSSDQVNEPNNPEVIDKLLKHVEHFISLRNTNLEYKK